MSRHQNQLHGRTQILLSCATADESLAHTHSDIALAQKTLRHMQEDTQTHKCIQPLTIFGAPCMLYNWSSHFHVYRPLPADTVADATTMPTITMVQGLL